jgi:Tfp pilus assembly protein PilO
MSLWQRVYSERRGVLLPVLILIAINLAVLALGVFPLQRSVASSEEGAVAARAELAAAKRLEQQARQQKDSRDRAGTELQKFYAEILPSSHGEAGNVTNFWLERVARDAGVRFHSGTYEAEEVRDSRLVQYTGKVTLTGDYAEIRKFLFDVETAEEFVIIEEVALASPNTAQPSSDIEVSLTVTTYFLAPGALEARTK